MVSSWTWIVSRCVGLLVALKELIRNESLFMSSLGCHLFLLSRRLLFFMLLLKRLNWIASKFDELHLHCVVVSRLLFKFPLMPLVLFFAKMRIILSWRRRRKQKEQGFVVRASFWFFSLYCVFLSVSVSSSLGNSLHRPHYQMIILHCMKIEVYLMMSMTEKCFHATWVLLPFDDVVPRKD